VLGEVGADRGIGKPSSTDGVFVVSTQSEEQRIKVLGTTMNSLLVGAAALAAIGVVLAVFAIRSTG
jgi:hypothetical protein